MLRHGGLNLLFLGVLATTSADPQPRSAENEVSWSETFKDADLKGYMKEGEFAWSKEHGGIVLLPGSAIAGPLALGFDAEIQVDVLLAKDLGRGSGTSRGLYIYFRAAFAAHQSVITFSLNDGKVRLSILERPAPNYFPDVAGTAPEGPWTVKMRLRYGVVQAKVWPKGKPEPTGWQLTRFTGDSGWEPRRFMLHPAKDGSACVTRVEVRGTKSPTNLFTQPIEPNVAEKMKVAKVMQRTQLLRQEGDLKKAKEHAADCYEAAKKVFGAEHPISARCLFDLADTLYEDGLYDDALRAYEDALKIARKGLPADHPYIAQCIEGIGLSLASKGEWKAGEQKHRAVLAYCRRVLGDEHPATAFSWNCLGLVLALQAKHNDALECYRAALKVRKAVFGEEHPDTAQGYNNLGHQLFLMGDYLAALPNYEKALKLYTQFFGTNHPATAIVEHNLAYLLQSMGRLGDAKLHYEAALKSLTAAGGEKHPLRARTLACLGVLACENGDYIAARTYFEEAYTICKETLGPNHPETAEREICLSVGCVWVGGDRAKQFFEHAEHVLNEKLPKDHPIHAMILHGLMLLSSGEKENLADVRKSLETALKIRRESLGIHHPYTLDTIATLAVYEIHAGEIAKAEKMLSEALTVCQEKLGRGHPLTCRVHYSLAAAYYAHGKFAESAEQFKKALVGFINTFGPQHAQVAQTQNFLALVLAAQGKRSEALAAAASSALRNGFVARQWLAGTPEISHAAIVEQWRPEVRLFFSLAATDPEKLEGQGPALFLTAMDWKATSGRALLDRLEALIVGQVPQARTTYNTLLVYRSKLVREIMRGVGTEGIEEYHKNLDTLRDNINKLERELAKEVKGYAALAQARQAEPAEVAKHIPTDGVLIEFMSLDAFKPNFGATPKGIPTEATYLALVVIPKASGEPDVKLVPLGSAKTMDEAIAKWRAQVQKKKRDPVIENQLREKLWDPIAKAIPVGIKRLFIAPAGQLAIVPFEAIWHDEVFLIEKYLISYCSTGRDLISRPTPSGDQPGQPVLVADPDFDHIPPDLPVRKDFRPGGVSELAYASDPPQEDRLDGFTTEADAVEKLFKQKFPGQLQSLRRLDATEENLQKVTRPRVLYFITHGNFLKDQKTLVALEGRPVAAPPPPKPGEVPLLRGVYGEDPRLRSYLCLTGFNHWKKRARQGLSDGMLTAREVEGLDLWGTDLVVTAACKTGLGDVQVGEGVMGLRRAFQQAGARTVVTSLWSVSDDKTAILLPRFLQLYLNGTPKAESLRKAQLEMIAALRDAQKDRDKQFQATPFAWAAFVCHGLPK